MNAKNLRALTARSVSIATTLALAVFPGATLGAAINWVPDADGFWDVAANWSSNPLLPTSVDDVTINVGGGVVRLYGDLKRHEMGRQLAEPGALSGPSEATLAPLLAGGAPVKIPASVFLTAELWGVGNTGPWLHDGRAGTLAEAIALHGEDAPPPPGAAGRSEAQEERDAYLALSTDEQGALTSFLKSLVLFSPEAH